MNLSWPHTRKVLCPLYLNAVLLLRPEVGAFKSHPGVVPKHRYLLDLRLGTGACLSSEHKETGETLIYLPDSA